MNNAWHRKGRELKQCLEHISFPHESDHTAEGYASKRNLQKMREAVEAPNAKSERQVDDSFEKAGDLMDGLSFERITSLRHLKGAILFLFSYDWPPQQPDPSHGQEDYHGDQCDEIQLRHCGRKARMKTGVDRRTDHDPQAAFESQRSF